MQRATSCTRRTGTWRSRRSRYSWKAQARHSLAPAPPSRCTTEQGEPPPCAVACDTFPREPTWFPALQPANNAPRSWARRRLSPPLSRSRGAQHRGRALWQQRVGIPLLILVVATVRQPDRPLRGSTRAPARPSRRMRHGSTYTPSCGPRRSPPSGGSTSWGSPRQPLSPPADPEHCAPPSTWNCDATRGLNGSPASHPIADRWPLTSEDAGLQPWPAPPRTARHRP